MRERSSVDSSARRSDCAEHKREQRSRPRAGPKDHPLPLPSSRFVGPRGAHHLRLAVADHRHFGDAGHRRSRVEIEAESGDLIGVRGVATRVVRRVAVDDEEAAETVRPGRRSRNGQRTQAQCRSSSSLASGMFQGAARKVSRSTCGLTPAWTNRTSPERQLARKDLEPGAHARGQRRARRDRAYPSRSSGGASGLDKLRHRPVAAVAIQVSNASIASSHGVSGSSARRIIVS